MTVQGSTAAIAWAAGFFDGEGCFTLYNNRTVATITQAHREVLDRFCTIVGVGKVHGPYGPFGHRQPVYMWRATSRSDFDHVVQLLHPWLGSVKRADAHRVSQLGGPGATPKTHCPQHHPYDHDNTEHVRQRNGHTVRRCRKCRRKQRDAYNAKRRNRHLDEHPGSSKEIG